MMVLVAVVALTTCKKEDPPPTYPSRRHAKIVPDGSSHPRPEDPDPWISAPPTFSPKGPVVPAIGLPCADDDDRSCPFAHCISSRCGGCSSAADCKMGSFCAASATGFACLPVPPPRAPPPPPPMPTGRPDFPGPPADLHAQCTDHINRYRVRANAPPLQRASPYAEICSNVAAASDAEEQRIHGSFGTCGERAQNECPGRHDDITEAIDRCLDTMFAEGPGPGAAHGNYVNMMDLRYHAVACGIYRLPDGTIWIVQDFFP